MFEQTEQQPLFEYYFSLEEAVRLIPEVKDAFRQAHAELDVVKDEIILYKRIHMAKRERPMGTNGDELEVLKEKWAAYEQVFNTWVEWFLERNILLRDMEKGLIDFPYRTRDGEEFLLCWHLGEDGIMHFHSPFEGFQGRKPITFLPD